MFYRLDGHKVVKCELSEMELFVGTEGRTTSCLVGQDTVGTRMVSTVFLCVDHGTGEGEPQLFETAVFEGARIQRVYRYPTWEAAEHGHSEILKEERAKYDEQTTEPVSQRNPRAN